MKLTIFSIFLAAATTIIAAPIPNTLLPVEERGQGTSQWQPSSTNTATYTATNTATGVPVVPTGLFCNALPNAANTPNTGVTQSGDQSEAAGAAASDGKTQSNQGTSEYTEPGAAQAGDSSAGCSDSGPSSASTSSSSGSGDGSGDTTSSEGSSAAAGITNPDAQNAHSESEAIAKSQTVNTPLGTVSVSGAGSEAVATDNNGDAALATGGGIDVSTPLGNLNENSPPIEFSTGQATANEDSGEGGADSAVGGAATSTAVDGTTTPVTGADPNTSGINTQSQNNPNGDAGSTAAAGGSPSGKESNSESFATGDGNDAAAGVASAVPGNGAAGTAAG